MPTWKKVIVSGSTANLAALQVDNLTSGQVVIGGGTSNLSTTAINGTGNIVATTGATGLSASGSFSGSFQGNLTGTATTASFVLQAVSASFATSASQAVSASFAITASFAQNFSPSATASYALQALSASYALTASFAPNIYNSDGSILSNRTVTIPTSTFLKFRATSAGSLFQIDLASGGETVITGLPTGISSSILSLDPVGGKLIAMATSSIQNVVSSSFASTASFVTTAQTASYVLNAVSASFATSASRAVSASRADTASLAITASFASTASFVTTAQTASYVLQAVSASFATTASFASTASFVTTAQTASFVLNAVSASLAQTAKTASNITPAITNNTNNYVLTANGDGTINGEANLQFTGTTLTVTGNEVITGNLTVQGTASFQQTTNLEVADRFILLASGSNTTGDGGLVVQQGTQNIGELYGYDAAINRWAFTSSFTANQSVFTPSAYITTTEFGGATPPTSPIYGGASNGYGNIFVSTGSGDIFIYS